AGARGGAGDGQDLGARGPRPARPASRHAGPCGLRVPLRLRAHPYRLTQRPLKSRYPSSPGALLANSFWPWVPQGHFYWSWVPQGPNGIVPGCPKAKTVLVLGAPRPERARPAGWRRRAVTRNRHTRTVVVYGGVRAKEAR